MSCISSSDEDGAPPLCSVCFAPRHGYAFVGLLASLRDSSGCISCFFGSQSKRNQPSVENLRWHTVVLAHPFQKTCLVAPVMNQHRLLDAIEDGKEFPPNSSIVLDGVCPQVVLDGGLAVADAHAD